MKLIKKSIKSIRCSECGDYFRKENIVCTKGLILCSDCWKLRQNEFKYKLKMKRYIE